MTQTIWKFRLGVEDSQVVLMPENATILSVQMQHSQLFMWALVDPRNREKFRRINIAGTGHDLSERIMGEYISTFQMHGDGLVFHIFDGGWE